MLPTDPMLQSTFRRDLCQRAVLSAGLPIAATVGTAWQADGTVNAAPAAATHGTEPLDHSDAAEQQPSPPPVSSLRPSLVHPSQTDTTSPAAAGLPPPAASSAALASAWSYCGYSYLFSSMWATQYLQVQFEPQATSYFGMNPEAMAALALAPVVRLGLRLTIHRRFDSGQPLSVERSVPLDGPARHLLDTALGTSGQGSLSISLPPFFPKFIRLPSVDKVRPR